MTVYLHRAQYLTVVGLLTLICGILLEGTIKGLIMLMISLCMTLGATYHFLLAYRAESINDSI